MQLRLGEGGLTPKSLPLGGKVAPQGRMRGELAATGRKRVIVARLPLISQRAGPLTASPKGEATDCLKRCAHPLAHSARGLRPQAVGERTVRLSEIFRAMARFSPSAPSGHRSPSGASATSPVSGESVSQREVFRHAGVPRWGTSFCMRCR